VAHLGPLWEELRGARLLITGGTGFFGAWLLESLCRAEDAFGLGLGAWVLSRDPEGYGGRMPHVAGHPAITLIQGDVRDFELPSVPFTHVVHAATSTDAALHADRPWEVLDTILGGTRHLLESLNPGGLRRLLMVSSGAVYGEQPSDLGGVPETHSGGPDPLEPSSAYAEGKRAAELLCAQWSRRTSVPVTYARGFAFVGPHLPLDAHFAIGNFLRDALNGQPIVVQGDGTPMRSYLYGSDLAVWLWTILLRGRPGAAYNVGSDEAVSIAELAREIATLAGVPVEIRGTPTPGMHPKRYVPSIDRARSELGLEVTVPRREAICRTLEWHRPGFAPSGWGLTP